jgi:gamma-glutamylputrescine oxidase
LFREDFLREQALINSVVVRIAERQALNYNYFTESIQMLDSFQSKVFWYDQQKPSEATPLRSEIQVEVVIVGGGMAGLSCAQRLSGAGISVAVVEKEFCGSGASGKSSGFLTPASEIELRSLISSHGKREARRIWDFVVSGVEVIRQTILEHGFACDYQVQDSLYVGNDASGWRSAQAEHRARLQLGFESQLYHSNEISNALGTSGYSGAVRYGGTFAINSYAYCQALSSFLKSRDVKIFESSPVIRLRENGVDTAQGAVRARQVVVCADRFIPELGALRKVIYHVQTFLGISKTLSDEQLAKVFPYSPVMTWDSDLVYNYFRATGENRLLVGGSDLLYTYARSPEENMKRRASRMTSYFRRKFPGVPLKLEYVWPGMLGVSKDLLPVMGSDSIRSTIWYAGAAAGLPWAAALGRYAADRILSGRNEFDDVFSYQRKFVIGPRLQALLSTPLTYGISHGIEKFS